MPTRQFLRRTAARLGAYESMTRARDAAWRRRRQRAGTFSQFGEDQIVLRRIGETGAYLDIGANHPYKGSNTFLLYNCGWSGLTVEPIERLCALHRRLRTRDSCLNAAVGSTPGSGTLHELIPSALSTFDARGADQLCEAGRAITVNTYEVPIVRAADAWDEAFPGRQVDLVSIDTEGFELDVLDGLELTRLRPTLVLVEFEAATGSVRTRAVTDRMENEGYELDSTFGVNGLFVRTDAGTGPRP